MATFYGGEQLSQLVEVNGTFADLDTNEAPVVYTVPTGFYGRLKFAFVGNNNVSLPDVYFAGFVNFVTITYVPKGVTVSTSNVYLNSATVNLPSGTYSEVKRKFGPNTITPDGSLSNEVGFYDMYLEAGSRLVLRSTTVNTNVKYEAHIELYKKP